MINTRTRQLLFALFCAALLLPRLGGPHLHLCLDGSAPPVSLHIADDADNQLADGGHEDRSIDMSSPVIGKLSLPGLGGLLIPAVLLVFAALQQAMSLLAPSPGVAVPLAPPFLRPLLRGPPA